MSIIEAIQELQEEYQKLLRIKISYANHSIEQPPIPKSIANYYIVKRYLESI